MNERSVVNSRPSILWCCLLVLIAWATVPVRAAELKWFKGNLHTHTLWSDGDDYPEMVVAWYREHGYDFLSLSDHNVLLAGERWISTTANKGKAVAFNKYLDRYGTNWVVLRAGAGEQQVRLRTLEEFRGKFERPGEFLLIPAEEITDQFKASPVHLIASNLRDLITPRHGSNVTDTIQRDVNAVLEQRKQTGQAMIAHINHPNFEWGITAEDMVAVVGDRFFEVYNGHSGVRNYGDKTHASTERMWDILLTRRAAELGLEPIWGTAVDDSHGYHTWGLGKVNPGRGWVMVHAAQLTPTAIVEAMERGDFYASSGVRIKELQRTPKALRVTMESEPGVKYTTQFIGTRKGCDLKGEPVRDEAGKVLPVTLRYSDEMGKVLAEVDGDSASYTLKGDEIYVRAKVISSRLKENPYAAGDHEMAWVQPVLTGIK